jgi:predicted RND superfamily exporter protein
MKLDIKSIVIISTILIFIFIFISQLRVHEGMSKKKKAANFFKKAAKGIKSTAKKAAKGIKSTAKKAAKGIKSTAKKVAKGAKSAAKKLAKSIKSNSIIKLTNQLNQYKANLAASINNERALTSAANIAGTTMQNVNNDMGTVRGTISSVLNTNRVKQPYRPFSI